MPAFKHGSHTPVDEKCSYATITVVRVNMAVNRPRARSLDIDIGGRNYFAARSHDDNRLEIEINGSPEVPDCGRCRRRALTSRRFTCSDDRRRALGIVEARRAGLEPFWECGCWEADQAQSPVRAHANIDALTQHLFVKNEFTGDAHTGPLIEAGSAGRALDIDT